MPGIVLNYLREINSRNSHIKVLCGRFYYHHHFNDGEIRPVERLNNLSRK